MYFRIEHESAYQYDVPVRLSPHSLRLIPRPFGVEVLSHQLDVEPEPTGRTTLPDSLGNLVTTLSFLGETERLRILSRLELHTQALTAPSPLSALPLTTPSLAAHPGVRSFAERVAWEAGSNAVAFLDRLSRLLFEEMDRHVRPEGAARASHETLALGSGACRDLTVLFLDTCAVFGLEGRFVSGYQALAQTPYGRRQLHAWAEVLVPGDGYHGWDPMHGTRAGDGHVALYAAPTQAQTMPIEGGFTFDGPSVRSTLDHEVWIATGP